MTEKLDFQAYEREVVRPLRPAPNALPGDLVTRYAVGLGMTAEQLRARVAEVVSLWNRRAGAAGASPLAAVYKSLQRAHDDLRRQPGVRLDDPDWWREQAASWAGSANQEVAALAEEARQWYGSAGFVLPGQVADLKRRHPALGEAGVRSALEIADIPVITPAELPQRSGLDRQTYDRLAGNLDEAGAATIAHLLHPGITAIRLLPTPDARGAALTPIDRAAVERRTRSVETEANSAQSRAATGALGILHTAESRGTGLRQLAIFHVLDKVRDTRAAGQPVAVTLVGLAELGVAQADARLLAASLLALEGTGAGVGGPEDVRRLVATGQLAEARRRALALPTGDAEAEAAREIVAKAEAEVSALLAAARAALAAGNEEDASLHAVAASSIAADDPAVTEFADGLPPPPAQRLVAVADGIDVKLSWQAAAGTGGRLRYRVVRRDDRLPVDPDDGVTIAEDTATSGRDEAPPAAQELRYAVFATANRLRWSRAAGCAIEVVPPVTGVTVDAAGDAVRVSGRSHPQLLRAVVRRRQDVPPAGLTDGTAVTATRSGFADIGPSPGTTHCYAITAVYRGKASRERMSETVFVTAVPQQAVRPVSALLTEVLPGEGDGVPGVRISWRWQDGVDVRILRARAQCPWPFGARVPIPDVLSYGEEVAGRLAVRDGRAELTAELPWGLLFLTPFVFYGDAAVVGHPAHLGLTPPIGAVSYERRGREALLSWEWPDRANAADVRWQRDGRDLDRRITRGQRVRDDGWTRIEVGDGPARIEVRAIEISPAGDALSGPRVVEVAAASRRLRYEVIWKPVLPGATPRSCEVPPVRAGRIR